MGLAWERAFGGHRRATCMHSGILRQKLPTGFRSDPIIMRRMNTISRRSVLALPLIACRPLADVAFAAAAGTARPNILFIMTDDHAAQAISCYGSKVNQTPHLDRLAKEGMRMDRVFATNAICTPSRATILTGKYSHLNGVPVFNRFDGSQPTVAEAAAAGGLLHRDGRQVAPRQRPDRASTTGTSCRGRASTTTRPCTTRTARRSSRATPPTSSPTSRSTC